MFLDVTRKNKFFVDTVYPAHHLHCASLNDGLADKNACLAKETQLSTHLNVQDTYCIIVFFLVCSSSVAESMVRTFRKVKHCCYKTNVSNVNLLCLWLSALDAILVQYQRPIITVYLKQWWALSTALFFWLLVLSHFIGLRPGCIHGLCRCWYCPLIYDLYSISICPASWKSNREGPD